MYAPISIGSRTVGFGHAVYIVAEIGLNHNGDTELARKTIDAAKASGADAVKFQNYRTEDFVPTTDQMLTYISQGREITEAQHDLFKRYELKDDDVIMLADYCRSVGIDFHSTPTNAEGVKILVEAGVGVLKNGSDFLSHIPLIEAMARTRLPTVISTGMASIGDIDEAVQAYQNAGGKDLILLHCVSQYPTPPSDLNLRRIKALRDAFEVPVGFSDHSEGETGAALSVAMGAIWIEKHFTLDQNLPGPDHRFSSNPDQMVSLVSSVRDAEAMLGHGSLSIHSENEARNKDAYRLSCAAARDLEAGTVLLESDIAFFRPGTGLPPSNRSIFVNRALATSVKRGQILSLDALQ